MTLEIRPMVREELDVLVDWAHDEGWNPGLDDADIFWATDPDGFVAAEMSGELIGGGSIVSYGGAYGFMGFFIVRPDKRSRGIGHELWYWRRNHLLQRLDEGAPIGMDGVYEMMPFYSRGGFELQHRDLRFEGPASASRSGGSGADVVEASSVDLAEIIAYDSAHFPAARPEFLRRWVTQPGGHALVAVGGSGLAGLAVSRPCRAGHKIGPLFADDPATAEALFVELCGRLAGEQVQLDVPECNPDAMELARRHGMVEVFGCAKMHYGRPPDLPYERIFGVTTFELG